MAARVVHCKKEKHDYYIGRPSLWGNPYKEGVDGTREEVIARYEEYARNNETIQDTLIDIYNAEALGCWCAPKPCHGDVLVKLAEEKYGTNN